MIKLALVVALTGCWTSSTKSDAVNAPPPAAPVSSSTGGAGYGGATYGGATYGVIGTISGGAFGSITGTGDGGFDDRDVYGGLLGDEVGEMEGGWGVSVGTVGTGGGGTGQGTIGTGRYGTIGHGSGTGSGYGTTGGAGRKPPQVKIGTPAQQGGLDRNIIRRYIRRSLNRIRYCYEKELVVTPDLAGKVTAAFTIGVDGKVSASSAKGLHANVDRCIATVIKAIEFPKPTTNRPVVVTYPFVFSPGA